MSIGIYKIENLINHKIYIGQSVNIERRFQRHKNANDNFIIHKALKKYGIENFEFSILELCPQEQLNKKEIYWINYYNSLIPNGYNMVDGGSNGSGKAKGKIVLQYDLNGNFIQEFPSAHEADRQLHISYSSICACCRGEIYQAGPYQWKYKNSDKKIQPIKGVIFHDIILQIDKKGHIINEFQSLDEASKKTGTNKTSICMACKGKYHTANGYIWQYKNHPITDKINNYFKPILQIDKCTNEIIEEFENVNEAFIKTKINKSNICSCLTNKRQTAGGYKWKYKEIDKN